MSFKWTCTQCNANIIVPYKSKENMSAYAFAYCPDCFKKIDEDIIGEYCTNKDENGNEIECYFDIDGIIFKCKYEE